MISFRAIGFPLEQKSIILHDAKSTPISPYFKE